MFEIIQGNSVRTGLYPIPLGCCRSCALIVGNSCPKNYAIVAVCRDDSIKPQVSALLGQGLHLSRGFAADEEGLWEGCLVLGQGQVMLRRRRDDNPVWWKVI